MYEIQVVGQIDNDLVTEMSVEFGDVVSTTSYALTLVSGEVPDQSALVGLLDHLHALGVTVVGLQRVPVAEAGYHGGQRRQSPAEWPDEDAQ